jgi:hypothetical protein
MSGYGPDDWGSISGNERNFVCATMYRMVYSPSFVSMDTVGSFLWVKTIEPQAEHALPIQCRGLEIVEVYFYI